MSMYGDSALAGTVYARAKCRDRHHTISMTAQGLHLQRDMSDAVIALRVKVEPSKLTAHSARSMSQIFSVQS